MLRLITGLLVLAALAGGVLYFQSDVFRPKMDAAIDAWTKWTPENITKDPEGYLRFALSELEKIEGKLKAHQLKLKVDLDTTTERTKKEMLTVAASTNALVDLKKTYVASEKTYPVSYKGQSLAESQFQEKVVEVDRQLDAANENVNRLEQHVTHLQNEIGRTEREMKSLAEKRQFVQQQLDHVKLDLAVGLSDELTNKANEIKATAQALASGGSKAKQEAVNLVKSEERKLQGQSTRERFQQIMASN